MLTVFHVSGIIHNDYRISCFVDPVVNGRLSFRIAVSIIVDAAVGIIGGTARNQENGADD
jgi:hypothetical protein